jgi:F0F1-type ATP synthase membrane subunit b/b'
MGLVIVMVYLLNVTLLKPINRILKERERRTKGRFREAQALLQIGSDKLREFEIRMREARAGGYLLLERERTSASLERERKVSEVKLEATRWLEDEKRKLQADEEQVKARLRKDARVRAREIGGQILGRAVSPIE